MKIIAFNETADLHIIHPSTGEDLYTEDDKPITVTIYGSQSSHYRKAFDRRLNKSLASLKKKQTAEKINSDAAELLENCTVSLNNFDSLDFGSGPIGSDVDIKKLYMDTPWLKDQVDVGVADNDLFLASGKPKKN